MKTIVLSLILMVSVPAFSATVKMVDQTAQGTSNEIWAEAACPAPSIVVGGGCEYHNEQVDVETEFKSGDLRFDVTDFGPNISHNSYYCHARRHYAFEDTGSVTARALCLQ